MGENYRVASIVIGCVTGIFVVTTVLLVQSDKVPKTDESINVIMSAPSEALKLSITGVFGFISGGAVQMMKKKEEEEKLKQRNDELEKENSQLRELTKLQ